MFDLLLNQVTADAEKVLENVLVSIQDTVLAEVNSSFPSFCMLPVSWCFPVNTRFLTTQDDIIFRAIEGPERDLNCISDTPMTLTKKSETDIACLTRCSNTKCTYSARSVRGQHKRVCGILLEEILQSKLPITTAIVVACYLVVRGIEWIERISVQIAVCIHDTTGEKTVVTRLRHIEL